MIWSRICYPSGIFMGLPGWSYIGSLGLDRSVVKTGELEMALDLFVRLVDKESVLLLDGSVVECLEMMLRVPMVKEGADGTGSS